MFYVSEKDGQVTINNSEPYQLFEKIDMFSIFGYGMLVGAKEGHFRRTMQYINKGEYPVKSYHDFYEPTRLVEIKAVNSDSYYIVEEGGANIRHFTITLYKNSIFGQVHSASISHDLNGTYVLGDMKLSPDFGHYSYNKLKDWVGHQGCIGEFIDKLSLIHI